MARKNVVPHEFLNLSLSSAFSTDPTVVQYLDNLSFQINVNTSDSTGSFSIEISNNFQKDALTGAITNPGNWEPLPFSDALSGAVVNNIAVSGASDVFNFDINQLPFEAIRVSYTPTIAGTGTCDIYFNARQIGG